MDLPHDFVPATEWVLVTPEIRRSYFYPEIRAAYLAAVKGPGWNPRTVELGGLVRAINYCGHPRGRRYDARGGRIDRTHPHSFQVAVISDHPFLRKLPKNAPRAVRTMFTAETRMRWLRCTEAFDYLAADGRANDEWRKFCENGGLHVS